MGIYNKVLSFKNWMTTYGSRYGKQASRMKMDGTKSCEDWLNSK